MKIDIKEATLTISNQEACNVAYYIKKALEESILTHYISIHHDSYKRGLNGHAKPLFEEQKRKDLELMKQFACIGHGRNGQWMEDELWRFLEKEYIKKNGDDT